MGPNRFTGVLDASFSRGDRRRLILTVPLSRVGHLPVVGDCFSGDVLVSDRPDQWSSDHVFLSFLDNGRWQGSIRPWNVFVPVKGQSGQRQAVFSAWSGEKLALLESSLSQIFPEEVAGLLESMVLSDTSRLTPALKEAFLSSGVYHLLSVSGEHLGLLVAFFSGTIVFLIRLLPMRLLRELLVRAPVSRLVAVLVLPVLFLYTILIGAPSPAVRALLAACLILLLSGWGRPVHREDLFGVSVMGMIFWNPEWTVSLSMELSLMALLGVMAALRTRSRMKMGHSMGGWVSETIGSGLWVTLFTIPLLWAVFGVLDLVGILSNPVIVPLAGEILLPSGFACLAVLWFFGQSPSVLTGWVDFLGQSVIGLATFFSRTHLGQISLPALPPLFFILLISWLLALFLRRQGSLTMHAIPVVFLLFPMVILPVSRAVGRDIKAMPPGGHRHIAPSIGTLSGVVPDPPFESIAAGRLVWSPEKEFENLRAAVQLADVPGSGEGR